MKRDVDLIAEILEVYEDYDPFEDSPLRERGAVDRGGTPVQSEDLRPVDRVVDERSGESSSADQRRREVRRVLHHVGMLVEGGYLAREVDVFGSVRPGLLFSALAAILLIGCSEPESSTSSFSPDSGASLSVDTSSTDRQSPPASPPSDSSQSVQQSASPSPTAIALLRGDPTPYLFPLAKYIEGTFHEDGSGPGPDPKVHDQYQVYVSDTTQPTFTVNTVDTTQMACTDVRILRGHLEPPQLEYAGPHIALSAPADQSHPRPRVPDLDTILTAAQRTTILDRADELLPPLPEPDTIRQDGEIMEVNFTPDDSLHLEQSAAVDLEGDGTTEFLAVAKQSVNHITGTIYDSAVLVGRISGSRWEELFVRVDTTDLPSPGYRLVEVIDVNGDNFSDLVLERLGYEGHIYLLFAYRDEGFVRVADVGYGC